ncbi:hypothetical protein HPB50_000715 [Hyalomma asiaticum]|uniref:Uncharacterized protein n=1 Tax=Hyalomma asiaticum TaxID=266040 RepID=A0ACB7SRH5_HYAAI|nr:hypothetical protein HPB50_000715 [Hyalomma asiaticum]
MEHDVTTTRYRKKLKMNNEKMTVKKVQSESVQPDPPEGKEALRVRKLLGQRASSSGAAARPGRGASVRPQPDGLLQP